MFTNAWASTDVVFSLPLTASKALGEKRSKELRAPLSDLHHLNALKGIFSSMCLIPYSLSFCLTLVVFSATLSCLAITQPRISHPGPHLWADIPPRIWIAMGPTHHTLEEERWGERVYRSTHGRCMEGGDFPSLHLLCALVRTAYLLFPLSVPRCKGVAAESSGNHFPSMKPIAIEMVCNFRGR